MKELIRKIEKLIVNKNIIGSMFFSLLLCIFGYFSNNWPIFTGIDLDIYTGIEWSKSYICNKCDNLKCEKLQWLKELIDDSDTEYPGAFFVNTSFDKQLVPVYEEGYNPQKIDKNKNYKLFGYTNITDRCKLRKFLELLKQTNYKYIIIDLSFADADNDTITHNGPKTDKELFECIKSMPRCVVATHKDLKLLGGLECKAALAEYKSTVTSTNFIKYEYFDSIPSIPLYVYNDLRRGTKDTIQYNKGWVFSEGDILCHNCVFLEFSHKSLQQYYVSEIGGRYIGFNNYYNMGVDFVDPLIDDTTKQKKDKILCKLKGAMHEKDNPPIVYIGNLTEDLHDTYAGLQPGVLVLYKALDALNKERHHVSAIHTIILVILYFFIILFIIKGKGILDLLPSSWQEKHIFICFIVDIFSLTTILFIVKLIDIMYFHTTTNFIFVLLACTLLKLYIKFKTFQNK